MITRKRAAKTGDVKITFSLPAEAGTVSVVGDFNGWDPGMHQLKKRSNGKQSVVIDLTDGAEYRFRYLGEGGRFFDDPEADRIEPNGQGETHSIIST
jgi:1,4-alpha-glucan branching enzyme